MALLSISIDLSGSTYAKQLMTTATAPGTKARKQLYEEYLSLLYHIERSFYEAVFESTVLKFEDLYLLKTIGDEYWFGYHLPMKSEETAAEISVALIEALLNVVSEDRFLTIVKKDGVADSGGSERRVTNLNLPTKVLIDLIHEPIELNVQRYEYLKDIVLKASGGGGPLYQINDNYIQCCNRLNLGAADAFAEGHPVHVRDDFIGLEIDRFFRVAKFCQPRLLTIGNSLMEFLSLEISTVAPGLEGLGVKMVDISSHQEGEESLKKYLVSQVLPAQEIKGVGEDYSIHHLFGERNLGDAAYCPQSGVKAMMEPTRAFLAKNGFYSLEKTNLLP